ncbi:YARHG domain-containing protein [Ruminococcus gauvreauii]|uniref:YARHG domain-containing protein n=1 Tax=Ruminococcus gauvreauii TaxID=438033 RepID=A0ABY5VGU0_9FIRM|nr:YARHG domain-containing protein [Ruminococcus gauvreauii]UWP59120.1 YARHG domain-containing protein [Ruminococcus gauvreauii]
MFCEKCGSKLESGDLYCPGCGRKLTGHNTQQYQPPRKKPETDGKEKALYALLGVVAVLLVIGIIWGVATLVSLNREEEQYAESSKTEQEHTPEADDKDDTVEPAEVPAVTVTPVPAEEPEAVQEPVVTPEPAPTVTPAPLPAQEPDDSAGGDYVIPDSSSRQLDSSDLSGLSEWELRVARNEIYARHGRMFNDSALDSYFRGKSWYVPSIPAENFDDNTYLSKTELKNAKLISDYEASKGYS